MTSPYRRWLRRALVGAGLLVGVPTLAIGSWLVYVLLTVPSIDVAGSRVGPVALLVHDAGLNGIDGLLGRDVLDAFTVTIDTAAGRATLTPR